MHRHKQLFEQVCSFENLYAAARKALRGKRSRVPGATFLGEMERARASPSDSLHRRLDKRCFIDATAFKQCRWRFSWDSCAAQEQWYTRKLKRDDAQEPDREKVSLVKPTLFV